MKTPTSHVARVGLIYLVAQSILAPSSTTLIASPTTCAIPVPIIEYKFNETGTTAPSTGADTTPVTFKDVNGNVVDFHGAAGSGVTGLVGDRAFDNRDATPPTGGGPVGLGGYGGRAEQPGDDNNLDALKSMTLQGWFKSNDPGSVADEGRLFDKNDGLGPVNGGGGYFLSGRDGHLRLAIKSDTGAGGGVGEVDSSTVYFSTNQWIFFAVTYDGTSAANNVRFYRGTSAGAVELTDTRTLDFGTLKNAAIQMVLGNGLNAVRAFPGLLDNMRIFGSQSANTGALSLGQLEALRASDVFPVPIVEYKFNETGTTAPSTGADTTPVTFKDVNGNVVDFHGAAGSGVAGLLGDRAFDNRDATPPTGGGPVGLGGYGGRAEQPGDDNNLDALKSMTLQGWFKSNDPGSVADEGRLFDKNDGLGPVNGGGGYFLSGRDGHLRLAIKSDTGAGGGVGEVDSSTVYFSSNQWIFFAVTYDGTSATNNVRFYRGTSAGAVELTDTRTLDFGTLKNAAIQMVLGNGLNAVRAFPGLLDNMRVFGSLSAAGGALSLSQLEALRAADALNVAVSPADADHDGFIDGCDLTAPTVTPTVSGTLGNGGWYVSNVTVQWQVTDNQSAISSMTGCGDTSITTDTGSQTVTCSATSEGGTTTQSVVIKRDATAPTATATASPPANSFGWRKTNVTVAFLGSDATSGIASCDPQVVLSSQGTNLSASGKCTDNAGNQSALANATGIKIDKTDPTITVTTPVEGTSYNRNQNVLASFSCGDALSGVASCVGSVATGQRIDTSKKVQNGKFTVNATDQAGNTAKMTVNYSVK